MRESGFDFLKFQTDLRPSAGRLLVANPFMPDSNFRRSVVLLAEHGAEGTVGFVVNKPVDLKLNDVLTELPTVDVPLAYGGPVQLDTLHFLHTQGDMFSPCTEVVDGVFWGGEFSRLRALLDAGMLQPSDVRFFVGYAGWGPGQLQDEIDHESWIVTPASASLIFEVDSETLWQQVLKSLGGEFAVISNFPEDPRMN